MFLRKGHLSNAPGTKNAEPEHLHGSVSLNATHFGATPDLLGGPTNIHKESAHRHCIFCLTSPVLDAAAST